MEGADGPEMEPPRVSRRKSLIPTSVIKTRQNLEADHTTDAYGRPLKPVKLQETGAKTRSESTLGAPRASFGCAPAQHPRSAALV